MTLKLTDTDRQLQNCNFDFMGSLRFILKDAVLTRNECGRSAKQFTLAAVKHLIQKTNDYAGAETLCA